MVKTPNVEQYKQIIDLLNKQYKHAKIVETLGVSYTTIQSAIKYFQTPETLKPVKKTPISESVKRTLLIEINKLLSFDSKNRLHKIGANILNQLKILRIVE